MEDVNALSQHSTTFHCGVWAGECHDPDGISSGLQACAGCQTGYHTYSAIIDRTNTAAEQLRFYLDGNLTYTVNENEVSTCHLAGGHRPRLLRHLRPGHRRLLPEQGLRLHLALGGAPARARP